MKAVLSWVKKESEASNASCVRQSRKLKVTHSLSLIKLTGSDVVCVTLSSIVSIRGRDHPASILEARRLGAVQSRPQFRTELREFQADRRTLCGDSAGESQRLIR